MLWVLAIPQAVDYLEAVSHEPPVAMAIVRRKPQLLDLGLQVPAKSLDPGLDSAPFPFGTFALLNKN